MVLFVIGWIESSVILMMEDKMSKLQTELSLKLFLVKLKVDLDQANNILFADFREEAKERIQTEIKGAEEALKWVGSVVG